MGLLMRNFLVLFCWMILAVNAEEYVTYKDPNKPLNRRIKDLMKRMSLEEKIGQMIQIDRTAATPEVMNKYYLGKK